MGRFITTFGWSQIIHKEEFFPNTPNRFLFILGPGIAMSTALITSAVIPWGDTIEVFGQRVLLQATDIDVSVLYIFGVLSIGVYGIMIGAWASNNKYSLMSAVRASSQMISYESSYGIINDCYLNDVGSLSLKEITVYQAENGWNILYQPVAFIIFLICSFAETNRTPF